MFEELKLDTMKLQEAIENDISIEECVAYMTQAFKNGDVEEYNQYRETLIVELKEKKFSDRLIREFLDDVYQKTSISEIFGILGKYNLLENGE